MADSELNEALLTEAQMIAVIGRLAEEEHQLETRHVGERLDAKELARLEQIEKSLDQCWDLLRQRRARRHAGLDTGFAQERRADVVEDYEQ
jgi:hypothetical protein